MGENQFKIIDKQIEEKTRNVGNIQSEVAISYRSPDNRTRTTGSRETLWSVKSYIDDKTHCAYLVPYTSGGYYANLPLHKVSECVEDGYCYRNNWKTSCLDGDCVACSGYSESIYWAPQIFDFYGRDLDRIYLIAQKEGLARTMRPKHEVSCYSTEVYRDSVGQATFKFQTSDSIAIYVGGLLQYTTGYRSGNLVEKVDFVLPSGAWTRIDVYHYAPKVQNGIVFGVDFCDYVNKSRYPVIPSGIKWNTGFPTWGTYEDTIALSWHWASGISVPDNTLIKVMASGNSVGLTRWSVLDVVENWETNEYVHRGLTPNNIVYYKIVPITLHGDSGQASTIASGATKILSGPKLSVSIGDSYYSASGSPVTFTIKSDVPLVTQPWTELRHLYSGTTRSPVYVGLSPNMPDIGHGYQSCDYTLDISNEMGRQGKFVIYASGVAWGDDETGSRVTTPSGELTTSIIIDFDAPGSAVYVSPDEHNPLGGNVQYSHTRNVYLHHTEAVVDPKPLDGFCSDISHMRFAASGVNITSKTWEEYSNGFAREYQVPDIQGSGRVFAQYKDRAGNISAISSGWYILDTVMPSAPVNFTVSSSLEERINVSWDAAAGDTDIWHYRLFRYNADPTGDLGEDSASIDSAWPKIVSVPYYTDDAFVNQDVTKWYSVTAVDYAGNESAHAGPESGFTWNEKPGTPTISDLAFGVDYIVEHGKYDVYSTATWAAVADVDMNHYEAALYASIDGLRNATILTVPHRTGASHVITWHFLDAGQAPDFRQYQCQVRAIDSDGNAGDWSAVVSGTAYPDLVAPPQITGLSAAGYYGAVEITWNRVAVNDMDNYVIFREDMLTDTDTVKYNTGQYSKSVGITAGSIAYDPTGQVAVVYDGADAEDTALITGYVDEGVWVRFLLANPLLTSHTAGETVKIYDPLAFTSASKWFDQNLTEGNTYVYNIKAKDKAGNIGKFASAWGSAITESMPTPSMDFLMNQATINLVKNASFELQDTDNSPVFWNGTCLYGLGTDIAAYGKDYVLVNNGLTISHIVSGVAVNRHYVLSAYAKQFSGRHPSVHIEFAEPETDYRMWIQGYGDVDDAGIFNTVGGDAKNFAGLIWNDTGLPTWTDAWGRMYMHILISGDVATPSKKNLRITCSGENAGYVSFDAVMLQEGTMPTQWLPYSDEFVLGTEMITETEITSGAVIAPKIAANSVLAKHIFAGAIGAYHLSIGRPIVINFDFHPNASGTQPANLVRNPSFEINDDTPAGTDYWENVKALNTENQTHGDYSARSNSWADTPPYTHQIIPSGGETRADYILHKGEEYMLRVGCDCAAMIAAGSPGYLFGVSTTQSNAYFRCIDKDQADTYWQNAPGVDDNKIIMGKHVYNMGVSSRVDNYSASWMRFMCSGASAPDDYRVRILLGNDDNTGLTSRAFFDEIRLFRYVPHGVDNKLRYEGTPEFTTKERMPCNLNNRCITWTSGTVLVPRTTTVEPSGTVDAYTTQIVSGGIWAATDSSTRYYCYLKYDMEEVSNNVWVPKSNGKATVNFSNDVADTIGGKNGQKQLIGIFTTPDGTGLPLKGNEASWIEFHSVGTTIDGDVVKTGSLYGRSIVGGSITAREMAANSITADIINADAIRTRHLQARNITGEKIAALTISGSKIKANTLDVGHIVVGAQRSLFNTEISVHISSDEPGFTTNGAYKFTWEGTNLYRVRGLSAVIAIPDSGTGWIDCNDGVTVSWDEETDAVLVEAGQKNYSTSNTIIPLFFTIPNGAFHKPSMQMIAAVGHGTIIKGGNITTGTLEADYIHIGSESSDGVNVYLGADVGTVGPDSGAVIVGSWDLTGEGAVQASDEVGDGVLCTHADGSYTRLGATGVKRVYSSQEQSYHFYTHVEDVDISRTWNNSANGNAVASGGFLAGPTEMNHGPFIFATDWIDVGDATLAQNIADNGSVSINVAHTRKYNLTVNPIVTTLVTDESQNSLDIKMPPSVDAFSTFNWKTGTMDTFAIFLSEMGTGDYGITRANWTYADSNYFVASGIDIFDAHGAGTFDKNLTVVTIYPPHSEDIPIWAAVFNTNSSRWEWIVFSYVKAERISEIVKVHSVETSGTQYRVLFYAYVLYETNDPFGMALDSDASYRPQENACLNYQYGDPNVSDNYYIEGAEDDKLYAKPAWVGSGQIRGFRGIGEYGGITGITITVTL